ncbi:MAG: hypothetical protein ACRDKL_11620 [Solirubrobacteraceae bacterium]
MSEAATAQTGGEPEMVAAARRICEQGGVAGVDVRLLGGIAIWLRSSDAVRRLLGRDYADIDLVTTKKQSKSLRDLLEGLGYLPDKQFNNLQGDTRLYYHAADGAYHVDIFLGKFVMSHELDLGSRLRTEPLTLPAAELLLTKLQVAELNRKDASDTVMLLADHELSSSDGPGLLNAAHVSDLCSSNWGLYTTITDNLQVADGLLAELVFEPTMRQQVAARIAKLLSDLEAAPKSGGWRRRAKIGRRMKWYQTPDEI